MDLEYSKHAIRERIFEKRGTIEHVPKHFVRSGCKNVLPGNNGTFKAVYIYDDTNDLVLVISPGFNKVVTNYLTPANNRGVYKGRFRLVITQRKGKLIAKF
jgi:hypothetical protein